MSRKMKYHKDYPWRFEIPYKEGVYWLSDQRQKSSVFLVQAVKVDGGMELRNLHGKAIEIQPDYWGFLPDRVKISAEPLSEEDAEDVRIMACRPLII